MNSKPKPPKPKKVISLLVPFKEDNAHRSRVWAFLREYWEHHLPDCEIVLGHDRLSDSGKLAFSKSVAVNDAFSRSHGDIIVVLDADAWVPAHVVSHCAQRIRQARKHDIPLWFVPYRHIFRITEEQTEHILKHRNPRHFHLRCPPPQHHIEDSTGSAFGHRYGALIQIYPREGFETVGCWDPRFRGWGGEDVSFLRAMDTLFATHKTVPGCVDHLWHPKFHITSEPTHGVRSGVVEEERSFVLRPWNTRAWQQQTRSGSNDWLSIQYAKATGDPAVMRELVDAGCSRSNPVPLTNSESDSVPSSSLGGRRRFCRRLTRPFRWLWLLLVRAVRWLRAEG